MNILIVDDEPLALEVLETYIKTMSDLHLVAKCQNAFEANQALREHQVDLMFLDIEMPQMTGTDFLKSLQNPPMVIFTTAYSNYAVDGFNLNAIDYLLKPISLDRFLKGVNKASEHMESHGKTPEGEQNFFFVKADKQHKKINFSDIIYIEGLKDYVMIWQPSGRTTTLQTMKSLEDRLPPNQFIRIHRSFIVAIDKITAIEGNMVEVLDKDHKVKMLPIGKNYRDELIDIIEKYKL
jgi:DNA-binding LytR/AlgR family response regulator